MKKSGRLNKRVGTGRAKGESKADHDYLPYDDNQRILKEMMDPYWSFRFMRSNGYGR